MVVAVLVVEFVHLEEIGVRPDTATLVKHDSGMNEGASKPASVHLAILYLSVTQ